MLQLLAILVIFVLFVVLMYMVVWLFVEKGWGFFRPKNNIEYVVLRGETLDHTVRDNVDCYAERQEDGNVKLWNKERSSLLYKQFGIRYFGFPFIYKLGKVIVNYPASLTGASGIPHTTEDIAPGFTVHRNYLLNIRVDFQGGITFLMQFNLEVLLKLAYVAWGRNGKFLDPLGQYPEGEINGWAMTINATDFIGKTGRLRLSKESKDEIRDNVDTLRSEMYEKILQLNRPENSNSNVIGSSESYIENLSGYKIVSIKYKGYKAGDPESEKRLELLEVQNEAILKTTIAEQDAKTVAVTAKGQANKTRLEGRAKAYVDQAIGMADVVVLEAKKKAVGTEVMIAELNANSIKETKATSLTLVNGQGVTPVLPVK